MPKVTAIKVLNLESFAYPFQDTRKQKPKLELGEQQYALEEERVPKSVNVHETDTPVPHDVPLNNVNPIVFPLQPRERDLYRTKTGKKLTRYQWDVYDFIFKIPIGKVTTYKIVADAVGGSPRSAGNALRTNPFTPYIPCHRVIASSMFIGGFLGQWAGRKKGDKQEREQLEITKKIALLEREGVFLDDRGYLKGGQAAIWRNLNE